MDTGAAGTFHVVGQLLARPIKDEVIVRLDTYVDKDAYTSGKAPMRQKRWTVSDQSYDTYFQKSVLKKQGNEPIGQAEVFIADQNKDLTITNG